MTQDEIMFMAMKSGCPKENALVNMDILEAFAKLVEERTAAKEREACAYIAEGYPKYGESIAEEIRARGEQHEQQ
jgi:hypothetical protein